MKSINIFAVFLIMVLCQNIFAQEPDPLNFFPHSVGNLWEYDTPDGILRTHILRDSLDEFGNKYLFYGAIFDPLYYVNINSNIIIYSPTRLSWSYYKLEADSGDYWVVGEIKPQWWIAYVSDVYTVPNVFGKERIIKEIQYGISPDTLYNPNFFWIHREEFLAEGIGLLYVWNEEDPQGPQKILRGCVIDGDTLGIFTSVKNEMILPEETELSQNYPNPFNPSTTINFKISNYTFVDLRVYDYLGREIAVLINEEKPTGNYEVKFDASKLGVLPSGVYVYRLTANNKIISRKMILIK